MKDSEGDLKTGIEAENIFLDHFENFFTQLIPTNENTIPDFLKDVDESFIRKIPNDFQFPQSYTMKDLDHVVLGRSHKGSSPGLSGFSYSALRLIYPAIKDT